jgi:hypothetical protein
LEGNIEKAQTAAELSNLTKLDLSNKAGFSSYLFLGKKKSHYRQWRASGTGTDSRLAHGTAVRILH